MSPLEAEACLALCKAAVLTHEPSSQGAPRSSSITLMEPRLLTCEAAGLARAHGAEQSQQGQPEGPEHGRAVARQPWASPERSTKGLGCLGPEKGPFCSLCCRQWQWLQRVRSQGAVPYACSLTPATATAGSLGAPACHGPFSFQADGIFEER